MTRKKSFVDTTFQIISIAFILVIIIITLGWFVRKKKIIDEKKQIESIIGKVKNDRKTAKQRLKNKKKRMLRYARIIIGIIIICIDLTYLYFTLESFRFTEIVNSLLTVNGAILLAYSFLAFITFGTIQNMVTTLRLKFINILKNYFSEDIKEIELFDKELKNLKKRKKDKEQELKNGEKDMKSSISKTSKEFFSEDNLENIY